jgi:hypothetical protein
MLYHKGQYRVDIAPNGAIRVKPGDWLSKYSYAMYGNFNHCDEFGRMAGGVVAPCADPNVIHPGETLYHIPTFRKGATSAGQPAGQAAPGSPEPQKSIIYFVPMVRQGRDPLCLVACVAMILSFRHGTSWSVADLTGPDPSKEPIPDPNVDTDSADMGDFQVSPDWTLRDLGFKSERPPVPTPASYIVDLLCEHGPFLLRHLCFDFDYGPGHACSEPNGDHTVVVTGIDPSNSVVLFNNPWGQVNQRSPINTVLWAMQFGVAFNGDSVAYLP